jgi:hypothetical protein
MDWRSTQNKTANSYNANPLRPVVTAYLEIGAIERDYFAGHEHACGPIEVGRQRLANDRF